MLFDDDRNLFFSSFQLSEKSSSEFKSVCPLVFLPFLFNCQLWFPVFRSSCLSICMSTCLPIFPLSCVFCISVFLSSCLPYFLPSYPSVRSSIRVSVCKLTWRCVFLLFCTYLHVIEDHVECLHPLLEPAELHVHVHELGLVLATLLASRVSQSLDFSWNSLVYYQSCSKLDWTFDVFIISNLIVRLVFMFGGTTLASSIFGNIFL